MLGILISYLVAEPIIALLRYVIAPYIARKFSKKKSIDEEEIDLEDEFLDEKKKKDNIRESKLHWGFEIMGEIVEAAF